MHYIGQIRYRGGRDSQGEHMGGDMGQEGCMGIPSSLFFPPSLPFFPPLSCPSQQTGKWLLLASKEQKIAQVAGKLTQNVENEGHMNAPAWQH